MEQTLVVIHVRFASDGSVREIGELPSGTSPQDWFNALSRHSANSYESFAGGRGIFRLEPAIIEQIKAAVLSLAT
ncbi:hypothetical protein F6A13_06430 [Acidithiobacillus sp. 'AMD consortium']|jgi:hypothetical protein|uniref:Uncharacterized protein n=2 Tax=Acidithiobacillus ferridurans TaxID=1232575 RepID=A0A8X8G8Y3_ACIFI|nr:MULTISPECIES: hypothetical protein [Acidithiobacillus]MBU2715410.1 hypothetical protein [Acidithiobacillus ferridurans]MBU2718790.1 hypothetical protein [Acidithiobacillus ferridurans]MBU2722134.1 hypothetical protein [Acidithiobacillus ferridurans]MBU2727871.1 hypothetical protein [Acidithiobacillus ferridurans]QFG78320.1 hypothetical protein F6A13_06430 [Acidithiobacillus sp. 'AMD consortium']